MRHVRRSCRRKGRRLHGATADRRKRQREAADGPTPTDGRRAGAATNPAHAALPGPRSPRARPRTFAGRIALPCSSLPSEDGAERRLFSSRMPIFEPAPSPPSRRAPDRIPTVQDRTVPATAACPPPIPRARFADQDRPPLRAPACATLHSTLLRSPRVRLPLPRASRPLACPVPQPRLSHNPSPSPLP